MKFKGIVLLVLLLAATAAPAGEVFGTITDGTKPLPAGVRVTIARSGKVDSTETDKFGSYRIVVKEKGKCVFTVYVKDQAPSQEVFSYDKSMRYDWTLETTNEKLTLRRK
jgi:hypothetical protein